MIGRPDGRAVYFFSAALFPPRNATARARFSSQTLDSLAPFDGPRVVYADACTLRSSARSRERIEFKQIPYQVQQQ